VKRWIQDFRTRTTRTWEARATDRRRGILLERNPSREGFSQSQSGVVHFHQTEALGGRRGASLRAIARGEDTRHVARRELASSHLD